MKKSKIIALSLALAASALIIIAGLFHETAKTLAQSAISSLGFEIKVRKLVDDTDVYVQLYGKESVAGKRFYNICGGGHFGFGGGFSHPCWTNVDIPHGGHAAPADGIAHDLLGLEPLPVASGSAELVHSQYTIEHITDQAAEVMFREVHRILKKGGVFRVVAPNSMLDYIAFKNNDISYYTWREMFSRPDTYPGMRYRIPLNQASLEQVFLVHFASNASTIHNDGAAHPIGDREVREIFSKHNFEDAMNICVARCSVEKQKKYRINHINWWTHDKLKRMLGKAGFRTIYILAPGQSSARVMRNNAYFDRLWNEVALFVEAVKE